MHDLISADRCYFMKSDPSRSSVLFIEPPRDMKWCAEKEEKEEKKGVSLRVRRSRVCVGFGQEGSSSSRFSFSVYALFIVVKVR